MVAVFERLLCEAGAFDVFAISEVDEGVDRCEVEVLPSYLLATGVCVCFVSR